MMYIEVKFYLTSHGYNNQTQKYNIAVRYQARWLKKRNIPVKYRLANQFTKE